MTRTDDALLDHKSTVCPLKWGVLHISHDLILIAVSPHWATVAKHPLPVHRQYLTDVPDANRQAKYYITFLKEKPNPSTPKYYSFSHKEGANIPCSFEFYPWDAKLTNRKTIGNSKRKSLERRWFTGQKYQVLLLPGVKCHLARHKFCSCGKTVQVEYYNSSETGRTVSTHNTMACYDRLGQQGFLSSHTNIAPYSVSSFSAPKRIRNGFQIYFKFPNGTREAASGDLIKQKMKYLKVVFSDPIGKSSPHPKRSFLPEARSNNF